MKIINAEGNTTGYVLATLGPKKPVSMVTLGVYDNSEQPGPVDVTVPQAEAIIKEIQHIIDVAKRRV